jgi:cation transport regulator ChaC
MRAVTYFAYGSNMLSGRLRHRVPSCALQGVAKLSGFKLSFSKRSVDGSGKCSIAPSVDDTVFGVVYDIPLDQKPRLDRAEGLGNGYHERKFQAVWLDGSSVEVLTYVADDHAIDFSAVPYSWYKEFVLAGAQEHGLPAKYIHDNIESVQAIVDPKPEREQSRRSKIVS